MATAAVALTDAETPLVRGRKARTNFQLARKRFLQQKLAVFGLVIVVLFIGCAVLAPLIAPTSYDQANLLEANKYPSRQFPFGTDTIGHDMVSRVIYGIRTSLIVAFSAAAKACLIGMPLGMAAGLKDGWLDFLVLRLVEIMTALPGILFAIFLMSVINSGTLASVLPRNQIFNVALVIAITSWVPVCRLMRAQILTLREQKNVTAARSIGATEARVAITHLLPNALTPMIIALTLADSRQYIQLYWHLGLFPSLAIALAVPGFAFLGDGLRDALVPRQI